MNKIFVFVFLFCYNDERFRLFNFSIKRLKEQIKKYNINSQIYIHEIGKEKKLSQNFINENSDIYMFTKFEGIFDRAWGFNRAIKKINFFEDDTILILLDCDLIFKDEYIKNLNTINQDFMCRMKCCILFEWKVNK